MNYYNLNMRFNSLGKIYKIVAKHKRGGLLNFWIK